LAPGTGIGKAEPCRERLYAPEAGKIGAARAGNTDIDLAKTHLSRDRPPNPAYQQGACACYAQCRA